MALSNTDKTRFEVLLGKKLKTFLTQAHLQQFENKNCRQYPRDEIKRRKDTSGCIIEIVTKVMKEFYKIMWTRRSFWEPSLKNVK